jgi:redox-sensitive bicupin YhaK (pirin superfamily)
MVMNTREEINQALLDLQNNTFIREKNPITE